MFRQTEVRAQRQITNSGRQDMSPQVTNHRQKNQPGTREEYEKENCSNHVHGAEAKMGKRTVHRNDTAAMSAGADRIIRRAGSLGPVVVKTL